MIPGFFIATTICYLARNPKFIYALTIYLINAVTDGGRVFCTNNEPKH